MESSVVETVDPATVMTEKTEVEDELEPWFGESTDYFFKRPSHQRSRLEQLSCCKRDQRNRQCIIRNYSSALAGY